MEASPAVGARQPLGRPALAARELTVLAGGRALLSSVSLRIARGELVALIGPSGAGKTTLLRALSGTRALHAGTVRLGDQPLRQRESGVGFVPSEDLIHEQLTVQEELLFAAALRAPVGTSDEELAQTVQAVLAELNLSQLAGQRVDSLSRGERRRTSCAVEVVGQPAVLLLDEPASGLDAGLERRLMRVLRNLADQGRAVLAATHATASLRLCDRVLVLGPGGVLHCAGTVDDLLEFFEVDSVEAVYERLEASPMPQPESPPAAAGPQPDPIASAPPRLPLARQLQIATHRSALCRVRDHRSLALLIGQAPVIGAAIGLVLPHDVLGDQQLGPYYGMLMSFMLVTAATWLGTIAACREIVVEIGIVRREVAVGLRLSAYLLSRCLTLFPVVIAQTGLLASVVLTLQPVPQGPDLVVLACMATGLASAGVGLWLSARSRTVDLAIATTPLIMIPQLLLAGALIPVEQMPLPLRYLADVLIGHWSFTALGSSMGLGDRLGDSLSGVSGLSSTSFPARPLLPIAAMVTIGVLAIVAAAVSLNRRLVPSGGAGA